jgi:hypothetical protein
MVGMTQLDASYSVSHLFPYGICQPPKAFIDGEDYHAANATNIRVNTMAVLEENMGGNKVEGAKVIS